MPDFKIGDRVRRIGEVRSGYHTYLRVGEVYVVETVHGSTCATVRGCPFPVTTALFELVERAEPTDEELAAEYRHARSEVWRLALALDARGYRREWKAPHRGHPNWMGYAPLSDRPDELRIFKYVTETVMVPQTKTITKEI